MFEFLAVSPAVGQSSGDWTIRLTGRCLSCVVAIKVGAKYLRTWLVINNQVITFPMPAVTPAPDVPITLVDGRGRTVTRTITALAYDVSTTPTITSILPEVDQYDNKDLPPNYYRRATLSVQGINFANAQRVTLDGVEVPFTVVSDNLLTAIRPRQTPCCIPYPTKEFAARENVTMIPPLDPGNLPSGVPIGPPGFIPDPNEPVGPTLPFDPGNLPSGVPIGPPFPPPSGLIHAFDVQVDAGPSFQLLSNQNLHKPCLSLHNAVVVVGGGGRREGEEAAEKECPRRKSKRHQRQK